MSCILFSHSYMTLNLNLHWPYTESFEPYFFNYPNLSMLVLNLGLLQKLGLKSLYDMALYVDYSPEI